MTCKYRQFDVMGGHICENPKNKEIEPHERICFDENHCMVKYQEYPLEEVKEILDSHIKRYEKDIGKSLSSEISYQTLMKLKSSLRHILEE